MCGKTSRFSGTSATPRATIACGDNAAIGSPRNSMAPCLGLSTPAMVSMSVVLPAPFGPSTQVMEPSRTSSDRPFRASIFPYAVTRSTTLSISRSAQVSFLDRGIVLDLRRSALGDLLAEVEHRDAVGDAHHQLHHVFDEHDRDSFRTQIENPLSQLSDLPGVHPGSRLVEQQELRPRSERARQLQPALLAEGQVGRELVLLVAEGRKLEQLRDFLAHLRLSAEPARKEAAARAVLGRILRHPQVLPDAELPEQPDVLERARDAELQALVDRDILQRLLVEPNFTRRQRKQSGDQVHDGALARAIRADQADDLALVHREVEPVDGTHAAEMARHRSELKHRASRTGRAAAGSSPAR